MNQLSHSSNTKIRLDQQVFEQLPLDLYIPPIAFEILLERFEGPLDFLLYLVRKNGVNLLDLDIAPIAAQYIDYISKISERDIELASEYLVMAALLADLKSRLLLPKPETVAIEEDPRVTLLARLEEYAKIKGASNWLNQQIIFERDSFAAHASTHNNVEQGEADTRTEQFSMQLLVDAMAVLLKRPQHVPHQIQAEHFSLETSISQVRQALHNLKTTRAKTQKLNFYELLTPAQGRMGIAVTFLAVLELLRLCEINIQLSDDVQTGFWIYPVDSSNTELMLDAEVN